MRSVPHYRWGNWGSKSKFLLKGVRPKVIQDLDLGSHLLPLFPKKRDEDFKDVPRRCIRNSKGSGGVTTGAGRDVDGQKANAYISIFPASLTSFSSFSICWYSYTLDIYSLGREGNVPSTESWQVNGSESKRTAAWGGAPRPHFKPQHYFYHRRNKHHAGWYAKCWLTRSFKI